MLLQGTVVLNFGRAKDLSDDDYPVALRNRQLWATNEEWDLISTRRPNQEICHVQKGKG
jgi:hypothetical protein